MSLNSTIHYTQMSLNSMAYYTQMSLNSMVYFTQMSPNSMIYYTQMSLNSMVYYTQMSLNSMVYYTQMSPILWYITQKCQLILWYITHKCYSSWVMNTNRISDTESWLLGQKSRTMSIFLRNLSCCHWSGLWDNLIIDGILHTNSLNYMVYYTQMPLNSMV